MAFIINKEELRPGLIIFQRGDVTHGRWSCRIRLPRSRYKTVALDTCEKDEARELAFKHADQMALGIKYGVALFNPPFSQVARAYLALQRSRASRGYVSPSQLRKIETIISKRLLPYVGTLPMDRVENERWQLYRHWRRGGANLERPFVGDATIAGELTVFHAVMNYAVTKGYLASDPHFEGKPKYLRVQRDAFTQDELDRLKVVAEHWVASAPPSTRWQRQMVYYFMVVMLFTGIRPGEARNLCWRDISSATDRNGTPIIVLSVRWRDAPRSVVARAWVGEYFDRIRAMSAATGPNDCVFRNIDGTPSSDLYSHVIRRLLIAARLREGQSGVARSTYSFRHSYAVGRLAAGVSTYLLAQQMGTTVAFIEEYYGYAIMIREAGQLLRGIDEAEPNGLA